MHRGTLNRRRAILGTGELICVADCELCTARNLPHVVEHGGRLVTMMPRSRIEDREFYVRLRRAPVRWRRIHVQPNRRRESGPPET